MGWLLQPRIGTNGNYSRKKMAGRLQQFVRKTKDKKDEEVKLQKEAIDKALSMVPRCELNDSLPEDARPEDLWKAIHANFEWSFGPSKGKSLKDTKSQFIKWAMRKLKDPVRTICHIEMMMREKKIIELPVVTDVKPEATETKAEEPASESDSSAQSE